MSKTVNWLFKNEDSGGGHLEYIHYRNTKYLSKTNTFQINSKI